jgi:hypothetical protein
MSMPGSSMPGVSGACMSRVNSFRARYSLLRATTKTTGMLYNHRSDVLAKNQLAQEIFEHFEISDNILRMLFLDPSAQQRWADWDAFARFVVGTVRRTIGPVIDDDPATTALISAVSAKSHTFALLWDSHEIDVHDQKEKTIRYEDLGEIRLDFELLTAIDTPNQFLVLHRTPAGTRWHRTAD